MFHLLRMTPEEREREADDSILEACAAWNGADPARRAAALMDVLLVADLQIAGSPVGQALRASTEPRSPEAEALWQRLMTDYRMARRSRRS